MYSSSGYSAAAASNAARCSARRASGTWARPRLGSIMRGSVRWSVETITRHPAATAAAAFSINVPTPSENRVWVCVSTIERAGKGSIMLGLAFSISLPESPAPFLSLAPLGERYGNGSRGTVLRFRIQRIAPRRIARRIHALKAQVRLGTVQLELSIIQEAATSGAARLAHSHRSLLQ